MKILVITTREIGDVFLSTPLIHSLRQNYPHAQIDALVFAGKGGMLQENPDLNQLFSIPERPNKAEHYALFRQIWRAYDLAISTLNGDRPLLYAIVAGKQRLASLLPKNKKNFWKYWFCQKVLELNKQQHTVLQNLSLARALSLRTDPSLIPPQSHKSTAIPTKPYVVLHALPRWQYKRWPAQNWRDLALVLQQNYGWEVVLTGGNGVEEMAYVKELSQQIPRAHNLAGQCELGQLTPLLQQAQLYVGPDTAITHLAAACCPMVALFGPTNPEIWSPWPQNWQATHSPFAKKGSAIIANIALVQGEGDCVPCHEEGCDRHRGSYSRCLDELSVAKVLSYVEQLLETQT